MTVTIGLAELEARARGALLDMGGELTPAQLRRMLCDARIVPVVLGEAGEPLDVGRARRTSRSGSAARSPPATAAAPTPDATDHRAGARSTT